MTIKCVYLGVAANQKGHKLYDLNPKSLFTSKDVVCYEEVFPFLDSTPAISSPSVSQLSSQDLSILSQPNSTSSPNQTSPITNSSTISRPTKLTQPPLWLQDYVHTTILIIQTLYVAMRTMCTL